MATIRLCDWTKQRLSKDEDTFIVAVGDQEFEVGAEGRDALLAQLEGETAPDAPQVQVVEKIVERDAPPPSLEAAQPGGVQIESDGDPFEQGPSSMPQPVKAEAGAPVEPDGGPDELLEIPDDPNRRLKVPPRKLAERIVEEATVRPEGTLDTLTMGAGAHRDAMRRMKELEDKQNERLRRRAPNGVEMNTDNERRPR